MQTRLTPSVQDSPAGRTAEAILRSCVHCGFCTATCPTYQLQGDELDGPRGRIYLIKQMLEGNTISARTRTHLDRCLSCRSCETTCPSGVEYGKLLDIGRQHMERRIRRPLAQAFMRKLLRMIIPYPERLRLLLGLAVMVRPLLPEHWRIHGRRGTNEQPRPVTRQGRSMLMLQGCVQSVVSPATNCAAARLLDRFGIALVPAPAAGCCGGISQHLAASGEAKEFMRRNIDAWWPHIEDGAEAILSSASGCGAVIKEYGYLLQDDPRYADQARRVSSMARDIVEVLEREDLDVLRPAIPRVIAFHSPCTLQHGQQLNGRVESLLQKLGFTLTGVADSHLCCGSAGSYSLLQPRLARRLLDAKLKALLAGQPHIIATANIGCQIFLAGKAALPVVHWIELLDSGASRNQT
jgi:glycolate oxidase iron-sulfur subunit